MTTFCDNFMKTTSHHGISNLQQTWQPFSWQSFIVRTLHCDLYFVVSIHPFDKDELANSFLETLIPPTPQYLPSLSPSPHNNSAARNRSGRQACSGSTPVGSLNATHHKVPRGRSTTGRGLAKRPGRQLFASCRERTNLDSCPNTFPTPISLFFTLRTQCSNIPPQAGIHNISTSTTITKSRNLEWSSNRLDWLTLHFPLQSLRSHNHTATHLSTTNCHGHGHCHTNLDRVGSQIWEMAPKTTNSRLH